MARHDAGWWAERVAEIERTGDAERVARSYQVTVKHLKWWRWRLGATAPTLASKRRSQTRKPRDEQRLLPIMLASAPKLHPEEREVAPSTIIETSRGRISIRGTVSP